MKHIKHILITCCAALFINALTPMLAFAEDTGAAHIVEPSPWMIIPFVLLLLAIALMPFINKHVWEHYYPHIAIGLGIIAIVYYVFFLDNPMRMLHSGIEFVSFICLIGSLFVVSGGMHINLRGHASPLLNTGLLTVGAIISNLVGTTGASMILIRPYLRANKARLRPFHVVFFIFIVSNMGGGLTPIGDPPLFLGYLKGVPFFWVLENAWHIWLISIVAIIGIFTVCDTLSYRKLPKEERIREKTEGDAITVSGMHNLAFLLVILVSVFIQNPPFLREILMLGAAAGSYFTTKKQVHQANEFNFIPIKEVGFLFLGLFATMVPALDWLELNASELGITAAGQFYWGAGILSSFLDNAPTYLNFLSAEIGLLVQPETVQHIQNLVAQGLNPALIAQQTPEVQTIIADILRHHPAAVESRHLSVDLINVTKIMAIYPRYLVAISVSAVFFGAMTYIGNAPNFMVKSIAEQSGAEMPSFFGYMIRYSIPILIPLFTLIWFLFFRG